MVTLQYSFSGLYSAGVGKLISFVGLSALVATLVFLVLWFRNSGEPNRNKDVYQIAALVSLFVFLIMGAIAPPDNPGAPDLVPYLGVSSLAATIAFLILRFWDRGKDGKIKRKYSISALVSYSVFLVAVSMTTTDGPKGSALVPFIGLSSVAATIVFLVLLFRSRGKDRNFKRKYLIGALGSYSAFLVMDSISSADESVASYLSMSIGLSSLVATCVFLVLWFRSRRKDREIKRKYPIGALSSYIIFLVGMQIGLLHEADWAMIIVSSLAIITFVILILWIQEIIVSSKHRASLPITRRRIQVVLREPRTLGKVLLGIIAITVLWSFSADFVTTNVWLFRGDMLYKTEDYEDALEAYERAIEIDPKHAGAWERKGDALLWLDRNRASLGAAEQAIEIDPERASAWITKGNALDWLDNDEDALAAYERAIEIDPKNNEARELQGQMLEDVESR